MDRRNWLGVAAGILLGQFTTVTGAAENAPASAPPQSSLPSSAIPDRPGEREPFAHSPVPSEHDGEMHMRVEKLLQMDAKHLEEDLQKWPRFQAMTDDQKARFRQHLDKMREHRHMLAMKRARALNLNLPPEKMASFEQSFWEKKLKAEQSLWKEIEPKRKALDDQVNSQLTKEYEGYKAKDQSHVGAAPKN